MRMGKGLALLIATCLVVLPSISLADQRQDWFVSAPRDEGTSLMGDFVLGAVAATLQQDIKIYGNTNQLTLFTNATAAVPFGAVKAGFDMRIVALSLGASAGVMRAWRGLDCNPGQQCTRQLRREKDYSGDFNVANIGFGELRAQLFLPFNDYVTGVGMLTWMVSNAPPRMYDYNIGVVHDGDYLRNEYMLFFKHPDFGALAPTFQVLNFAVDHKRHTQMNFGFTYLTRAGLVSHDDLFVWQMLFHNANVTGGYDNQKVYGAHLWRGPFTLLVAYRTLISL